LLTASITKAASAFFSGKEEWEIILRRRGVLTHE